MHNVPIYTCRLKEMYFRSVDMYLSIQYSITYIARNCVHKAEPLINLFAVRVAIFPNFVCGTIKARKLSNYCIDLHVNFLDKFS